MVTYKNILILPMLIFCLLACGQEEGALPQNSDTGADVEMIDLTNVADGIPTTLAPKENPLEDLEIRIANHETSLEAGQHYVDVSIYSKMDANIMRAVFEVLREDGCNPNDNQTMFSMTTTYTKSWGAGHQGAVQAEFFGTNTVYLTPNGEAVIAGSRGNLHNMGKEMTVDFAVTCGPDSDPIATLTHTVTTMIDWGQINDGFAQEGSQSPLTP